MKFLLTFGATILLSMVSVSSTGQAVNNLRLEQGLSNENVNTIFKDSFGFMWFGTYDGLNRFDGYSFKKFRNKIGDTTSLPDKEVYAIAEDLTRNLWIGTSRGTGILDNKNFRFKIIKYQPLGNNLKVIPALERVNDIKFDKQGNGFICTNNSGLLFYKKGAKNAVAIPLRGKNNQHYTVSAITFDHNDRAWLVVDNIGLCKFVPGHEIAIIKQLDWIANSIVIDKDENLWIGTNSGLYQYSQKGRELSLYHFSQINLQDSRIFRLRFDNSNKLWLATDGEGIAIVDVFGNSPVQIMRHKGAGTISSNIVHDIFFDRESRKWIGTWYGGINTIDERKNQFTTIAHEPNITNSLAENPVHSICEDSKKNIWIGTEGGGISVWDRHTNQFKNYVHSEVDRYSLSNNRVSSLIMDEHQNIWIGTHGSGVNRFDDKTGHFIKIPFVQKDNGLKYITRLFRDDRNNIWASCLKGRFAGSLQKGLYKYVREIGKFVEATYSVDKEIFSIGEDHNGNLLLGSLDKFIVVNINTGKTTKFQIGSIIRTIYTSMSGLIWIGTYDKGIMSYDSHLNQFKSYTENEGLCNNTVLNIEEDKENNIWISTYYGLSRFNPSRKEFDNFYTEDGLQSNQFFEYASAHFSNGELAFGGIKGLSYFQPDQIQKYRSFPNLTITGIRIANEAANADNEFISNANSIYDITQIKLPYDKSILSIDYVALEFSQPEKIKYAYYLQGQDKSWNYVEGLRNINYSHLNEGKYLLRIKSTNSSGIWNTRERTISIIVLPPWYRAWYAYVLYLLSLIGVVYFYQLYHKKKAWLEYEIQLANLKTLQEKELNEKKISFFTNISHELRAPLTLIVNPIKELLNNNGKNFDLLDFSSVYRNTRRLLSLVDQLMLFRKAEDEIPELNPECLNLKDVCQEVFLCFNSQVKAKEIAYKFQSEEDVFVFGGREQLEIVLFNVLSNAVKYTPTGGKVDMEIKHADGKILISVADTGPGIPDESADKLFNKFYRVPVKADNVRPGFGIGLFLAKKLVELNQGAIYFKSVFHKGTTFYISLPEVAVPDVSLKLEPIESMAHEMFPDLSEDENLDTEDDQHNIEGLMGNMVNNKPTVLLIDDDKELRKYIRQLLVNEYQVFEVENAEAGLKKLLEIEPDIIVCDVVMQGLSGVEFCERMKASTSLNHIPIILLTSSSSPEIKLQGIECGADDYITKPFESDLLIARINGIIKGRQTLKTYFFNEITLRSNSVKVPEEYRLFLVKCIEIIERHLDDENFNVKVFASEIGMSHSNLFKKIKAVSGLSINEYIRFIRLRKAAELMIKTDLLVKEIAYKVGFQQVRYFREQFYKVFEANPSEFIIKHRHNLSD